MTAGKLFSIDFASLAAAVSVIDTDKNVVNNVDVWHTKLQIKIYCISQNQHALDI